MLLRGQDYTPDPVVRVIQLWGKGVEQAHEDPIQSLLQISGLSRHGWHGGGGVARCQDGGIELWRLTRGKVGSPVAVCSAQAQLLLVLAQLTSSVNS